jgi:NAD-dependent dihydropyrimidine dehydrogenase PreA subunit
MGIERIEGCIGCGTCVLTCPTDVLRIDEKTKKAVIRYPQDCQVCRLCVQYCPVDAITITAGRTIPSVKAWG